MSRRVLIAATAGAIVASLATGLWISNRSQAAALAMPTPAIESATPSIHVGIQPVVVERAPVFVHRKPRLLPDCVGDHDGYFGVECNGKHGFPAISNDGKTIVDAVRADDGERGYPNLSLVYIDVKTRRVVRTVSILSTEETNPYLGEDLEFRTELLRRAAAAQRELDAAGYRSMLEVAEIPVSGTQLHASWDDHALTVMHTATNKPIGAHRFAVDVPVSNEHCSYELYRIAAWWDPITRIGIGRQHFTSGDFCGSPTVEQIFRL